MPRIHDDALTIAKASRSSVRSSLLTMVEEIHWTSSDMIRDELNYLRTSTPCDHSWQQYDTREMSNFALAGSDWLMTTQPRRATSSQSTLNLKEAAVRLA